MHELHVVQFTRKQNYAKTAKTVHSAMTIIP